MKIIFYNPIGHAADAFKRNMEQRVNAEGLFHRFELLKLNIFLKENLSLLSDLVYTADKSDLLLIE